MILNQTTQIYPLIKALKTAIFARAYSLDINSGIAKMALSLALVLSAFGLGADVSFAQTAQSSVSATNVTCNSVILKGDVNINPAGTPTTVWFQYGTSSVFENSTGQQTVSYSGSFSQPIPNLSPNTTYFYRAVANNFQFGTVSGSVFSFTTPSCGVNNSNNTVYQSSVVQPVQTTQRTNVTYVTERVTKSGLATLTVSSDRENVCRGDSVGFTIDYANVSGQTLKNVVLRVEIPSELKYRDASKGIYSDKDRMFTVDIGTLDSGEKGEVVVRADVASNFSTDKPLVTSASLVYTNKDGSQEEVNAYALSKFGCERNTNGALAFWGGDFFPTTILGWLILMLLIAVIIFLSRNAYGTYTAKKAK